jgi:hypothetical protein
MFIWWGRHVREKKLEAGYFLCPKCRTQQPCRRISIGSQETVYSLPVGGFESLAEQVQCGTCGARFEGSAYERKGAAGVMEPSTWECPKCANCNPNNTYQCLKCRYSLV